MKKTILILILFWVFSTCLSACDNYELISTDEYNPNVESDKIWTIDFEMQVPKYWVGKYTFDLNPAGDQLEVRMITDKTEDGAPLFTVFINSVDERETIIENFELGVEPIGLLKSKDGNKYFLGLLCSGEMKCEESEEKIFLKLINSVSKVVKTITPTEGCEIIEWQDVYLNGVGTELNRYNINLVDINDMIEPIIDGSLGRCLIRFSNNSINAVLHNGDIDSVLSVQMEILDILNPIVCIQPPQGYALEQKWDSLASMCNTIINAVQKSINAIYDRDATAVFDAKDTYSNTGILTPAIEIRNIVTKQLKTLEKVEENNKIISKYTMNECKQKAARYARYRFSGEDVNLIEPQGTMTTSDISGKYYEFKIQNEEKISILIDVENLSITERTYTSGGNYSYYFVSDGQLPAEEGDDAMPNIIGMTKEEAISLIETMGYSYEVTHMDIGNVKAGLVCRSYPEAGRVLFPDTVIRFSIQIEN